MQFYETIAYHCIALNANHIPVFSAESERDQLDQDLIQVGSRATIERLPLSDGRTYQVSGLQRVRSTSN